MVARRGRTKEFVYLMMNAPDLVSVLDGDNTQMISWISSFDMRSICNIPKFWHDGLGSSERPDSSSSTSSPTGLQGTTVTFSVSPFRTESMEVLFKAVDMDSSPTRTAELIRGERDRALDDLLTFKALVEDPKACLSGPDAKGSVSCFCSYCVPEMSPSECVGSVLELHD